MKLCWKTLLVRIIIWLLLEIGLNFLGLDDLADYSEFLWDRNAQVTQKFNCIS